ncbi:MAG TPA: alpha/beta fold hydrolase [Candidatus Binatia bacterium]|nr:alpha/beta fold hydrolase [Candidatus Binatia bacterium]
MKRNLLGRLAPFFALIFSLSASCQDLCKPVQGDFLVHDFHFRSGEVLPEMRLHYATYGKPQTDSSGRVTNAVLILHSTTGSGANFTKPAFAGALFGPGQLLDARRYFIILPDSIGLGGSAKPSDGMRAHFPHYDYGDMVEAQHLLLTEGLKINHLRLLMGTSMGCMHSFLWAETYPDFMDAVMPLACLPVEIGGRNRMMRKMVMDSITSDPAYMNGEYKEEPMAGLRSAWNVFTIMTSSPLQLQKNFPTRDQADAYLEKFLKEQLAKVDANDTLYAFNASRTYNPQPKLAEITAKVMLVNSADDVINPPELGIAEREIKKVKNGKFVLLPITDQTRGHGTYSFPEVWKQYLAELLK